MVNSWEPSVQSARHNRQFRVVYDAYFDDVARYCLRRLPREDARDAIAEVFVVAWRKIESIPPHEAALPWLYGVARNVVLNHTRSGRRALRLRAKLESEPQGAAPCVETQVVRRAEFTAMADALHILSPADQEAIRLRAYEGLTMREVSVVLGCSHEAAKKRVSRAIRRLRKAAGITEPTDVIEASRRITTEGGS